jgi:hypothetical protein
MTRPVGAENANPFRSARALFLVLPHVFIFFLVGCASRKPVSSISPSYRLESVDVGSLLLPPNIPAPQSPDAPVSLTLDSKREASANRSTCTASEGTFRMEQEPHTPHIRIVLPPLKEWLFGFQNSSGAEENYTIESLYAFLGDVDRAEDAGCFAATNGEARDYILQSIPTRPSDSLFNAYGYRLERSGVNLKPNLRLKVERAYFRRGEDSVRNYLGASDVLFDVTTNGERMLRFQQVHAIQYSPASLAQTDHEGHHDLAILDLEAQRHYRVLFYTHQVPNDRNFAAAIIGTNDPARLDQFELAMRADAGPSCESSTHDGLECLDFRGFVTVSVQVPVQLNGKAQFVDWGTKVKGVVPVKARKSFKMQRRFADAYYDLRFKRGDDSILDLTLVGGDRLTW